MTFFEGELKEKISALDPKFREKIADLFKSMQESISMLYDTAIRDEKTGLYNHKFFETIIDMEIEKAKRKEQKLSLMMIDIDFFKKINDTYGHMKADELLAHLANLLKDKIRKSDIAARFGGEEFFVLLPETNSAKAKKLAERLKKAIHLDKTFKKYKLTVSGGITQFREKGDTKKRLKERVDKALYKAKESGRDKFIVIE
jgi:diguanylate cyclase (GGDEF)-like protein